jgi:hypothetical protein
MILNEEISRIKSIMGLIVEDDGELLQPRIKPGVEDLFNLVPELSEIGTPQQYFQKAKIKIFGFMPQMWIPAL